MKNENGLYRKTPLMGWASWNCFRTDINEQRIREQMDALVDTGLAACGYVYANLDDGFFGGRFADGRLQFHKERFPHGIRVLADYAHARGLKAGIYSEGGDKTCGFYYDGEGESGTGVGLYGHEEQDLALFLEEYGFDFIKVDWCGGIRLGLDEETQYTKIGRIIDDIRRRTGRCIVYNICRWQFPGEWAAGIADSWRTGADICPDFDSVLYQIDSIKPLARYCGPGHVNDLDMMQIGNGLSLAEERAHFTMWCMMSSPLVLGCDLTRIRPETLEIVKNRELIAVDQDEACLQAYPVKEFYDQNGTLAGEVWIKDLGRKGSDTKAVAFLNRSSKPLCMKLRLCEAGLTGEIRGIRDLWRHEECRCAEEMTVVAEPRTAEVFRICSEKGTYIPNPWDAGGVTAAPIQKTDWETAERLVRQGAVLVDVREPEKYGRGHIKGAVNLPYYDLHALAGRYLKNKDMPLIVYCSTGKRSSQAQKSLAYMGYKNVYYLGGIEGLPEEKLSVAFET